MEFRCQSCGHLGPAADVDERNGAVGAVCQSCGTWSPLTDDGDAEPREDAGAPDDQPTQGGRPDRAAADTEASNDEHGRTEREQRDYQAIRDNLLPETGEGPRCPKCASLLDDELDNCPRCGLNLERAASYDAGEAPWETPPSGQENAHERAEQLWERTTPEATDAISGDTTDQLDPDALQAYVDHVSSSNLLEFGVRRLRFYLADHPDDDAALRALDDLAGKLQSKVAVAEARVESDAEEFAEDVQTVQRVLPWVVFVLIVVAIGLISIIMFG